jgi:hypothetical protein
VLLCGCVTGPGPSSYRVTIPVLEISPRIVDCTILTRDGTPSQRKCLTLLQTDYQGIVRELKAACLALGQTKAECQAD